MQRHPDYTRRRIARIAARVAALVHADSIDPDRLLVAGPVGRITHDEALALPHRPAEPAMPLGPPWSTWWLDVAATVPERWAGARVDLVLVTRSEATVWIDGRPVQGLTTGDHDAGSAIWRPEAPLTLAAVAGERLEARVEVACNRLWGDVATSAEDPAERPIVTPYRLERCVIARFDREAWDLGFDLRVLSDLLHEEGLDPAWAGELLAGLNAFCNAFQETDRATWSEARALLAPLLGRRNAEGGHRITAIGHGHIDTAWLWPIAETYRKCIRTFSTQLALLRAYPEHRFAASQAAQYRWVEEREPELFAAIGERVAAGQWIPVGGSWIEPDCNLPSGESLVRQLLHGQRYFEGRFGRRATVFWNPDVFGYNGQLPQLMRGAGMERFLTQKLSWNRFTEPPFHTFLWEGIDGSTVLTHFPPADTYNADATVPCLRHAVANFKDHDRSRRSLLLFGYGDGGQGPAPAMLETLARVGDLQGVPRTTTGDPEAFFDELAADADDLATVVGELYFEYHRGTYTTQARTKRLNRAAELALRDAELLAAAAHWHGRASYPREALAELWRTTLTNQFHDILPGSSIGEVYEQAERELGEVVAAAGALASAAADALLERAGGLVPLELAGVARTAVIERADGALVVAEVPARGTGRIVACADPVTVTQGPDGFRLANGALALLVGHDGCFRSLVHRATGREALAAPGNVPELYDDRPVDYEAWDIDPFALETGRDGPPADAVRIVSAHPERAELEIERTIGRASRIHQRVRLDAHGSRVELTTTVDWQEERRLLKLRFPLAVRTTRATYEMQFGVVERPTHYSTAADLARFEVPGHGFCQLQEHGFGVAVLSASTYGWSAHDGTVRVTLLRAPAWPDPSADRGRHVLLHAVLPHAGSWQDAGVVGQARALASPVRLVQGGMLAASIATCDDPNLVLDTVKLAEDGDDLVVRLYEAHGGRGTARVRLGLAHGAAHRCSLLEDPLEPVVAADGDLIVPYRPFEIVSLRVSRA